MDMITSADFYNISQLRWLGKKESQERRSEARVEVGDWGKKGMREGKQGKGRNDKRKGKRAGKVAAGGS